MTKALQKAFEAASRLPDPDQDELAVAILEELEADERWEAAFAGSQDALERLADEALEEHRAGRTKPLDPDAL
jgi:histidinol-phosphate/aromatic aminotransferase/cobyric acid decarboxylase-like protein